MATPNAAPRVNQDAVADIVGHLNALADPKNSGDADLNVKAIADYINQEAERMQKSAHDNQLANPNNDPMDFPDANRLGKDSSVSARPRARRIAVPPLGFDQAFPNANRLRSL